MDAQAEFVGRTDLVSLTLLAAVARTGSISGAGKAAGMTQQAASQRLRQLEQRIGIPLLRRRARGSTLTEVGAVAAQWAADVVEASQRFDAAVTALRSQRRPANVAASLTIAEYLLPRWLLQSSNARPSGGNIAVTAANSERVIELVTEGTHPLGFIESPHPVPHLTAETIARDELVVVVSPTHLWAARRSVPLATLADTPLVTRERGSGTRFSAEETMTAAGFPPAEPLMELPTTAAVRAVVASGRAPAILSTLAVRDDMDAGRLVKVKVPNIRFIRELQAIYATADVLDPALRDLLEIAKRTHPL